MAGFELHQHVHIAVGTEILAQYRAEQGKLPNMMAPAEIGDLVFGSVNLGFIHNFVALKKNRHACGSCVFASMRQLTTDYGRRTKIFHSSREVIFDTVGNRLRNGFLIALTGEKFELRWICKKLGFDQTCRHDGALQHQQIFRFDAAIDMICK